jgi:hypothetical protein
MLVLGLVLFVLVLWAAGVLLSWRISTRLPPYNEVAAARERQRARLLRQAATDYRQSWRPADADQESGVAARSRPIRRHTPRPVDSGKDAAELESDAEHRRGA